MDQSLTLTFVIILGLLAITPLLAKKIRMPIIVLEIIFGIILGKSGFNMIPDHELIEFFISFGLIYLMFLAGLDVNFEEIKKYFTKTVLIGLISVIVPFGIGVLLANFINLHPLLLGTIFSTTSLGLILPLSKEIQNSKFTHILLGSVVLVDIISMFLLAFSLTIIEGSLSASFFYSMILLLILFLIPWIIKKRKVRDKIEKWVLDRQHFEMEVRVTFAAIAILVVISEKLGFHSIIGAFIAGLIISELTPRASLLEKKLESFGYGIVIPLFFIFMGAKINLLSIFTNLGNVVLLIIIIVVGILAKVIGVTLVARLTKMKWRESIAMGFFHAARLSLIIAALEIGSKLNLINEEMFTAFMLLAVVSAIIAPVIGKYLLGIKKKKINFNFVHKQKEFL